jgi:hypothetical protein
VDDKVDAEGIFRQMIKKRHAQAELASAEAKKSEIEV